MTLIPSLFVYLWHIYFSFFTFSLLLLLQLFLSGISLRDFIRRTIYVLCTISNVVSQGNIFSISVAYVIRFILNYLQYKQKKKSKEFYIHFYNSSVRQTLLVKAKVRTVRRWITGLFSASHVLGNVLARFLLEKYIFVVCLCSEFCMKVIFHTFCR